jgi:serine O-acetyltransferase
MLKEIKADFARYREEGDSRWRILTNPAVWTLLWYRFGHWLYCENAPRVVRLPLKVIYKIGYRFQEVVMQMRLEPTAKIGGGLMLSHIGSINLHPDAVIGTDCDIAHLVTIGVSTLGRPGVPRLGNRVYVGTGATIIGNITIGDGAKIAANTLVISSVPAGATVLGVPGRVIMVRSPEIAQP